MSLLLILIVPTIAAGALILGVAIRNQFAPEF